MKLKLLFISLCLGGIAHAQVGINTEDPRGMLHVKGTTNDVVVKEGSGNVGIGTLNPVEKLHVEGDVKVHSIQADSIRVDGKTLVNGRTGFNGNSSNYAKLEIVTPSVTNGLRIEGNTNPGNYYMTSDGDGVGNWKYLRPNTSRENGAMSTTQSLTSQNTYYKINTTDLTLGKGKWMIMAKGIIHRTSSLSTSNFVEMELRQDGTNLYAVGVVTRESGTPKIAMPQISAIVHIDTDITRTYTIYARVNTTSFSCTSGYGSEPYFYAIKLDDQ